MAGPCPKYLLLAVCNGPLMLHVKLKAFRTFPVQPLTISIMDSLNTTAVQDITVPRD